MIPNKFQIQEAAIASYDYFDISARTGYKKFYAIKNNEGVGLITETIASNDFKTGGTGVNGSPYATHNFDLVFNAPNVIKGLTYASMTFDNSGVGSGGTSATYAIVTLQKISGGTTTTIGSALTTDTNSIASTLTGSLRVTLQWDIPITSFAIGDTLRMVVAIYFAMGGNHSGFVYHDPANRGTTYTDVNTGAVNNTDMILHIPFRIDV